MDISALFTVENLIALLTLTALEIVLGIDNIVFISILTGRLPEEDRPKARYLGLGLAMGARIGLLFGITAVMKLTADLFTVLGQGISGKDIILIVGGLFLVGKSTHEIHAKLEHAERDKSGAPDAATFASVISQIILLDMIFSLDSVITAVGMAKSITVMVTAVIIAVGIMMMTAGTIGAFVERHPTMKMLALAFLIMIGVMLMAEGFGQHISKGYVYFAMAFSLGVEILNLRLRKHAVPMVGGITGDCRPTDLHLPDRCPHHEPTPAARS